MDIRNLVPSIWNRRRLAEEEEAHPLVSLQRDMNRIFSDFFQGWEIERVPGTNAPFGGFQPSIDVTESESDIKVRAELPGMDENDIDVTVSADHLSIKGEKKRQKESKTEQHFHLECSYGFFQRVIPLPGLIEQEKAEAQFKKGILTVTLPKKKETWTEGKKIAINKE